MQSKAKTPKQYIDALEDPRKSDIIMLHELIQKTAPQLKPTMQFGMLGYGIFHYKYKTGREGDWMIIGLAAQKNYISLYVNVAVAQQYRAQLPKADIGKSCIRFKRLSDVSLEALKEVIIKTAQAGGAF